MTRFPKERLPARPPDELEAYVREQIAYWDRTLHKIGLAGME